MEDRLLHFYPVQGLAATASFRGADVIVCHGAQAAVVPLALSLVRHVPPIVVIDVGTLNGGRPNRAVSWGATRRAFRAASKIVWHSRGSKEFVEATAPELAGRGSFIAYGVDSEKFADYLSVEKEDYVLCAGSVFRDWDVLLKAWDGIRGVRLILLGAASKVATVNPCVEVWPVVDMETYCRMTAAARFTVLPLFESPISCGQMTLLQSLALGTPVVASNVQSIRDYLGSGTVSVPPGDAAALRDAVKTLWSDRDGQASLRREGLRAVQSEFSQVRMARELEETIWRAVDTREADCAR